MAARKKNKMAAKPAPPQARAEPIQTEMAAKLAAMTPEARAVRDAKLAAKKEARIAERGEARKTARKETRQAERKDARLAATKAA